MPRLPRTRDALLHARPLKPALKADLECLQAGELPLQQALRLGGTALTDNLQPMPLHTRRQGMHFTVVFELFFDSIIAGCQCADDPGPVNRLAESARLEILLDTRSSEARISLID
jgi:hypothetical protein